MLVHPTTINTANSGASAVFLSCVLDVASPRIARFTEVFVFTGQCCKRPAKVLDPDSESEDFVLEQESLMGTTDSIWDVLEWGFFRGSAWTDLLNLIVRIVGNDVDGVKNEELEESLLAVWLKDSGGEAVFNKAVRAIMATPGGEMMIDKPAPLYAMDEPQANDAEATDIWGGSNLLLARIKLLATVPPIWFIGPNGRCIDFPI